MKRLNSLVKPDLIRHLQIQGKLADAVYQIMDLDKQQHNIWVVLKRDHLTLLTDHPILATQLQYQQVKIQETLNKKFYLNLTSTRIKIAPPKSRYKTRPKEARFVVSQRSAKALQSLASTIEDKELGEVLSRLGQGRKRRTDEA